MEYYTIQSNTNIQMYTYKRDSTQEDIKDCKDWMKYQPFYRDWMRSLN